LRHATIALAQASHPDSPGKHDAAYNVDRAAQQHHRGFERRKPAWAVSVTLSKAASG
jgi:hypothetical protein